MDLVVLQRAMKATPWYFTTAMHLLGRPISHTTTCCVMPLVVLGQGDDIGKLLDVRKKSTCPCFTNFANKVG